MRKHLASLLFILLFATCLTAQTNGRGFTGASPNTNSGNIGVIPDPRTTTSEAIHDTDRAGRVTFSNASAVAVTIAAAGSAGFANNYVTSMCNIGAGLATLTPTTSVISYTDGVSYTAAATSTALSTGQCLFLYSDNSNYFAIKFTGGGSGSCSSGLTAKFIIEWNGTICVNSSIDDGLTTPGVVTINAPGGLSIPNGTLQIGSIPANCGSTTVIWFCPANNTSLGVGFGLSETWVVGSTGVTVNTLVQTDTSAPLKVIPAASGSYGVALSTVAAGGNVEVARLGIVKCVTDTGGSTAGHLVVIGTATVPDCKDSGQSSSSLVPITTRLIGVFLETKTAGNTALVELTPAHFGTQVAGGGTITTTIANGTSALGTGAISSATCATVVTTTATGTATTDNIMADFNADPTSVTGYAPLASGMLTIIKYPTTNNVNFKVCNNTASSITPGAITLNWRVVR